MKKKKAEAPINPKAIEASIALVQKAALPFANVARMSTVERSRVAKLKRGATQVCAGQPGGAQVGISSQYVGDEWHVWLAYARRRWWLLSLRRKESHHAATHVRVHRELLADCAHRPMLGEVKPPDLRRELGCDRHGARSAGRSFGQVAPPPS